MCGLAGMAGLSIVKSDLEMFKHLLFISSLRGEDSTGVATVATHFRREHIRIKKDDCDSSVFLNYDNYDKKPMLDSTEPSVFIGHCRAATVGKINKANAHPFETKNYIGAHNGTLSDPEYLSKDMTDSEMMFNRMDQIGIEKTLIDMNLSSAWALSIYEKDEGVVWLGRNHKRPLYVAFNRDRGVLYWASEASFLRFAADRLNQKIDVFTFEPEKLYRINIKDIKKGNDTPWKIVDLGPEITKATNNRIKTRGSSTHDWMGSLGGWQDDPMIRGEDNMWWDGKDCCICNTYITPEEVEKITPVILDGKAYYACKKCEKYESKEVAVN